MTNRRGCDFPGCTKKHYGRGLCATHSAQRWRGETLRPVVKHMTLEQRFWLNVDEGALSECWTWKLTPHKEGYGILWFQGVQYKAHRVSYELLVGEIPPDKVIDHKCRNRICVNPGHLHVVTKKENAENVGTYKNSPLGVRGVTQRASGKYRARVGHNSKVIHVGDFLTLAEAENAVKKARLKLHTNNLDDRGVR